MLPRWNRLVVWDCRYSPAHGFGAHAHDTRLPLPGCLVTHKPGPNQSTPATIPWSARPFPQSPGCPYGTPSRRPSTPRPDMRCPAPKARGQCPRQGLPPEITPERPDDRQRLDRFCPRLWRIPPLAEAAKASVVLSFSSRSTGRLRSICLRASSKFPSVHCTIPQHDTDLRIYYASPVASRKACIQLASAGFSLSGCTAQKRSCRAPGLPRAHRRSRAQGSQPRSPRCIRSHCSETRSANASSFRTLTRSFVASGSSSESRSSSADISGRWSPSSNSILPDSPGIY